MSDSGVQNPQSMMTEVASRLRETERRAATVISALEQQKSIQDSLEAAGNGLYEANSVIARFAQETKRATEKLVDTVSALRGVIDVLQQLNTAALKSRLDEIDQRARGIESEFKNLRDHIGAELSQLHDAVNATADKIVERSELKNLRDHVDTELSQLHDAVNATADEIVGRLTPRSVVEGVFGRRKR